MEDYFYARVSHRTSALSGLSEDAQFSGMRNYRNSLRVHATFGNTCYPEDMPSGFFVDRAKSGWSLDLWDRPAGALLLSRIKSGDRLFCYSVDRMSRSVQGFARLMDIMMRMGVQVIFVQERIDFSTAAGRMMGNMLAVLAQYYSDMISERTKEALALRRAGLISGKTRVRPTWEGSDVYIPEPKSILTPKSSGKILRYIRCSHIDSEESGLGLEQQFLSVTAFSERLAQERGLQIHPDVFTDLSVSAFHKQLHERPNGKRMLELAQDGDQLVFYRCDRGFRMPHDAANTALALKKRNIGIHLVDSNIDSLSEFGSLWLTMLSVFASMESQIKSNRNKEVARDLRAAGRPCGAMPSHCKVKIRDGVKKLEYDFKAIKLQAAAWIMARSDYTLDQISDVMHAFDCKKKRLKPRSIGSRKGAWCRYKVDRSVKRFEQLMAELPSDVTSKLLKNAAKFLGSSLDASYTRTCSVPIPVPRIEDRLAEYGIAL